MNKSCLSLINIEKTIGSKKILSNISFSVGKNEIVGLLGPNGAGKTTAFYIAAGLMFPNQGQVLVSNKDVTNEPMHARANLGLGYLPQESSLFPDLTVENNLFGIAELLKIDQEQKVQKLKKIINEFDLGNILQVKGRMLSGGQRRKVEIARTLICEPEGRNTAPAVAAAVFPIRFIKSRLLFSDIISTIRITIFSLYLMYFFINRYTA